MIFKGIGVYRLRLTDVCHFCQNCPHIWGAVHVQCFGAGDFVGGIFYFFVCVFKGAPGDRALSSVCEHLAAFDGIGKGEHFLCVEGFSLVGCDCLPEIVYSNGFRCVAHVRFLS